MATNKWNCVEQTQVTKIVTNNSTDMMTAVTTFTATEATTTATTTRAGIIAISDPGILCFHHCCVKVFCFMLPRICPQCKMLLYDVHDNNNNNNNNNNNHNNNDNSNNSNNNNDKGSSINISNSNFNQTNNNKRINEQDIINNGYIMEEQLDQQRQQQQTYSTDVNRATQILNNRLLPFRLPYPFIRASQYPCAIILRPTMGDFLNDYNNTTDLHIAVTTSTGCVVEFDRHGLRRRRTDHMPEWWQCLLVGDVPEPWYDYWDQILLQVCQRPNKWTIAQYHKDKYNCYTFVLTFLKELSYDKLSEAANSRTTFCEKYIVPRTTTAGKYISLYRKLRATGIYVHQIVQYNNNNNSSNKNHGDVKSINRQHHNSSNNAITSMKYKIKDNNININSQHNNNNNSNNNNNNNNNHNGNFNAITPNNYNSNSNGKEIGDNISGDGGAGAGAGAGVGANAVTVTGTGVAGNCLIIRSHTTLCTIEE